MSWISSSSGAARKRVEAEKPLLLCLMGPTASGKTDLAIQLVEKLNCELISVDSALVYRGMDIGSAKPDYPHHLVDIRDPAEVYSAADFVVDATRLIDDLTARGKVPLLVGGSMMYFKALLDGLAQMPAADAAARREIESEAQEHGWPYIHAQLKTVDPEAAQRIHPNHSQRLTRALEVYRTSGVSLTEWHLKGADPSLPRLTERFRVVQMAICPSDRVVLHERIKIRFQQMLQRGFLEEVSALMARGDLHLDLPSMRAVGYRQMWLHLAGEVSIEEATEQALSATRQLAKRQLTWLRKWENLAWIMLDHAGNVQQSGEHGDFRASTPVDRALECVLK